jgi:transcriptional regulator with XRE-family HTH domain
MDRALLADFLRARREALQPEEVGLPRGPRRRTGGLRREEVAVLAGMSADYYSRLEQQRGPMPSEQMLAALARGLKLSPSEREHLFALGGHSAPRRALPDAHTADPTGTAGEIVEALPAVSPEFAEVWRLHEVDVTHHLDLKRYRHPVLGELELHSRRLMDPDEGQDLLVFMAEPGSPSDEKLQRLITPLSTD